MAVDLAKDVVRDGHPYSTDSTWENVCQGICYAKCTAKCLSLNNKVTV